MLDTFFSSARAVPQLLLDAVLPPQCLACNAAVGAPGNLCPECFSAFNFITAPMCRACGVPLEGVAGDELVCGACAHEPQVFGQARAAFLYESGSRALVLKLKHGDRTDAAAHLARWLARAGGPLLERCDVIAPVPLHRWRLFMRTYNQSALLANALGKLTGKSVRADALVRIKATRSQGGLDRRARRRNVARAFSVRRPAAVEGRHVLLVDDVLTTGATANACAQVLLDAGAAGVDVLALARVPHPGRVSS